MTAEYTQALETIRKATTVYSAIVKAYDERSIGETEYRAARKVFMDAAAIYDAAFAAQDALESIDPYDYVDELLSGAGE